MEGVLSAQLVDTAVQAPKIISEGTEEGESAGNILRELGETELKGLIFNTLLPVLGKGGQLILDKVLKGKGITRAEGEALSDELLETGSRNISQVDNVAKNTDELVVADKAYLNENGNVHWSKYAPNGGFVVGTVKYGQKLEVGITFDRYGNTSGYYASPVGTAYNKRALPYTQANHAYHKYKVIKSIDNVTIGHVAPAFGQSGLGTQYAMPYNIKYLLDNGYIEEVF